MIESPHESALLKTEAAAGDLSGGVEAFVEKRPPRFG